MRTLTESQQLAGDIEWCLTDFLYWPTKHHYTTGVLWAMAASLRDQNGNFTPHAIGRPFFVSELGDTGKSLSTQILTSLVPGGDMVLNPTSHGLAAMLNAGMVPGVEEVDKKVGVRASKGQDLYAVMLGGYTRDGAVTRERNDKVDKVRIGGPMICNGNNANAILHHDSWQPMRTRSHMFLMEQQPEDHYLEEYDPEIHDVRFAAMRRRLREWGVNNQRTINGISADELNIPERIRTRQKQIWKILFRVAHFLGGDWPTRAHDASRALVLGEYDSDDTPTLSPSEEILWAVRATYHDGEAWLSTEDILDRLSRLPQTPRLIHEWRSYRAATMGLSRALGVFGIEHTRSRNDGEREWGYAHVDLYEDGVVPTMA